MAWDKLNEKVVTISPSEVEIGEWVKLDEKVITIVAEGLPPTCTPGETKCLGYDLYTCSAERKWQLTKRNATECGYTPPEEKPFPWHWLLVGGGIVGIIIVVVVSRRKD